MLEFRVVVEVDNRIVDLLQQAGLVFTEHALQYQVVGYVVAAENGI
jgi:hypothetical protein